MIRKKIGAKEEPQVSEPVAKQKEAGVQMPAWTQALEIEYMS